VEIEIIGFEGLLEGIRKAPEIARPFLAHGLELSMDAIMGRLTPYPPATEANQPGRYSIKTHRQMGYYDRGVGYWYPVKGGQEGKLLKTSGQITGYKLSKKRSERLGLKWTSKVKQTENGAVGEIGNTASYKWYVQGPHTKDGTHPAQAQIHRKHGWESVSDAVEDSREDIQEAMQQALDGFVKALADYKKDK
jgi:hypothetical protein